MSAVSAGIKVCARYLVSTKGNKELPVWAIRETTTSVLAKREHQCLGPGSRCTAARLAETGRVAAWTR